MISLIVGSSLSFVLAVGLTPLLIRVLRARGIGQPIHDDMHHHSVKAGTPTMGGLVVPIALLTAFPLALLVAGRGVSPLGLAAAAAVVAMGAVGLVDDGMKVLRERNVGLRERQKSILQTLISLAFALTVARTHGACTQIALANCESPVFHVPVAVFVLFVMAVFWGGTNSVNFADGIEGLLAGAATVTFAVLAGIGFWVFRHPTIYAVPHALDLALLSACLAGATCGLLWWNVSPRTIFMGDTGSLALGAGLVVICVGLGVTLLIPVVGALYVAVGASSFLQRAWFRWTRRRGEARRLFRMAPLHHHFEMVGWSEATIVIRFWIVNAIAAGAAVLIFYADALEQLKGQHDAMSLQVGVMVVQNLPYDSWRSRVIELEQLGYDGVYVWDHLVHRTQERTDPLFDGLTLLAAAAEFTSRLRLGTLVASPTIRHPVLLAKQAMTIDNASGGRMELGIGAAGVLLDYQVLGMEPWTKAEQVQRFRETVQVVDTTLRGETSYAGEHWSGEGVTMAPASVQRPRLPLTLAAHGPKTLAIAGRYADCWNTMTLRDLPPTDVLAQTASRARLLDEAAAEAGRDPLSIRRSVLIGSKDWPALSSPEAFRDAVLRYAEIGFSEIVLVHPDHPAEHNMGHGDSAPGIVRRLAEEVLPALREELA